MKKKIKESKLEFKKFTVTKLNNLSEIKGGGCVDGGGNDTTEKSSVVQAPPPPPGIE